jgi:hypothetical protein
MHRDKPLSHNETGTKDKTAVVEWNVGRFACPWFPIAVSTTCKCTLERTSKLVERSAGCAHVIHGPEQKDTSTKS